MATLGLYDYANAINGGDSTGGKKNNIMATDDQEVRKGYPAFMVRRWLAQSQDTVVCAEQMNLLHHVDDWMQWNYGFHTIPGKKRYDKHSKKSAANPDLLMISEFYQISDDKAAEYLAFFTDEQVNHIRTIVKNQDNELKGRKAK